MTCFRPPMMLAVLGCAVAAPSADVAAARGAELRLAEFTRALRIEHDVPTWGAGPVYIVQLWRDSVWELYHAPRFGASWQRAMAPHDSAVFAQVAEQFARSGLLDYAGTSLAQHDHGGWQFRATVAGGCAGLAYSHPVRVHWSPYPVDSVMLNRSVETLEAISVALALAVEWTPDTAFDGSEEAALRHRYVACAPP